MNDNAITALLADARRDLPADSPTASAIDRGAPLEEISACAEAEGLHTLAAALFGLELDVEHPHAEPAADILAAVLEGFRGRIPESSQTAAAIRRGAPAVEIAECAGSEGLNEVAAALFELLQEDDHP